MRRPTPCSSLIARARAWIFVAFLAMGCRTAGAQVLGRIIGPRGIPLVGAALQLSDSVGSRASTSSGDAGSFRFSRVAGGPYWVLSVRKAGYQPTHVVVTPADSVMVIGLRPADVVLDPIVVTTQDASCEGGREQSIARAVWSTAASGALPGLDSLTYVSYYTVESRRLAADSLGGAPLDSSVAIAWQKSLSWERVGWRRQIEMSGYARLLGGSVGFTYGAWRYAPLWNQLSSHFLDAEFGARHRFRIISRDSAGVLVGFCPRRPHPAQPYITGTLRFVQGQIAHAEWKYFTGNPSEVAAGWAEFAPHQGEPLLLLPVESGYSRILPDGKRYEEHLRFHGWQRAPDLARP
jgi:hypothetical protein